MIGWFSRLLCGWKREGHQFIARFEGRHAFHECMECGHRSPGIVVDGPAPLERFAGDTQRHRIAQRVRGRALTGKGYAVEHLQNDHFRIDGKLDLWLSHRGFHYLPTGQRGSYVKAAECAAQWLRRKVKPS